MGTWMGVMVPTSAVRIVSGDSTPHAPDQDTAWGPGCASWTPHPLSASCLVTAQHKCSHGLASYGLACSSLKSIAEGARKHDPMEGLIRQQSGHSFQVHVAVPPEFH